MLFWKGVDPYQDRGPGHRLPLDLASGMTGGQKTCQICSVASLEHSVWRFLSEILERSWFIDRSIMLLPSMSLQRWSSIHCFFSPFKTNQTSNPWNQCRSSDPAVILYQIKQQNPNHDVFELRELTDQIAKMNGFPTGTRSCRQSAPLPCFNAQTDFLPKTFSLRICSAYEGQSKSHLVRNSSPWYF